MRRLGSEAIALAAGLLLLSTASVLAANQGVPPNAPARMEMTEDGAVLFTPAGVTLYTFGADDSTPGKSNCTNVPKTQFLDTQAGLGMANVRRPDVHKSCAQKWPPYLADASAQPVGDFAFIERPEGGKQWTYRGRPLYMSVKDGKPGDRYGASSAQGGGRGRNWRFATVPMELPPDLNVSRREEGLTLVTNARPVYTPKGKAVQVCQGCDEVFKPITAPALANLRGDWSIVDAGAGRRQYAYKGAPLYAAPASLSEDDIAAAGGWEPVVLVKSAGKPPEIGKHMTLLGETYTNRDSLTLYTFSCTSPSQDGTRCDDPGDPAGYWVELCGNGEECAKRWKPYLATEGAKSLGDWSIVDVAYPMFTEYTGLTYPPEVPRVKAWAYRGQPVYTYYEDKKPGDMWGDFVGTMTGTRFLTLQVPGRSILE